MLTLRGWMSSTRSFPNFPYRLRWCWYVVGDLLLVQFQQHVDGWNCALDS